MPIENDSSLSRMQDSSNPTSNREESSGNVGSTENTNKDKKGRWTEEEHQRFLASLRAYGKDWYRVEEFIGTRSSAQIRSHAQKFISKLEKEPDEQYNDIKEILDINLRLLKKTDRDPTGQGPRGKPVGNSDVSFNSQKADLNPEQRQAHNLHPHHAHNRGAAEQVEKYDKYKEEYTLLPSQKLFKVEKMNPYERNEAIKQMNLDKELETRQQHRLINSQEEEKQKQNSTKEEMSKPSFLGAKDRPIRDENDPPGNRITSTELAGVDASGEPTNGQNDFEDKWQTEMDNQQIDHFAQLMDNLKPDERETLGSLPNNSNDKPVFNEEQDTNVERGTFVHGFSDYQTRYSQALE